MRVEDLKARPPAGRHWLEQPINGRALVEWAEPRIDPADNHNMCGGRLINGPPLPTRLPLLPLLFFLRPGRESQDLPSRSD